MRYVALLRGVNVGGRTAVAMADLRALAERLGLEEPRTLLQSGNLVFESGDRDAAALERKLAGEIARRLGVETRVFVRSAKEWKVVVARNPATAEARRDPGHLLAVVLADAPRAAAVPELRAAIRGREGVSVVDRTAYVYYPDGVGRSKLTLALLEKKLGTFGTGRNWNTVLKLQEACGS
jgi:uncharacterized protein (DUF1697 family)